MSTSPLLAGVAGEYFIAAELSRRGLIASIVLRNAHRVDTLPFSVWALWVWSAAVAIFGQLEVAGGHTLASGVSISVNAWLA